jgi:O-antigen/teichoic acid export membrane protein
MMGPLIPASAELAINRDTIRLEELYLRANFYFVLVAAPIATFFFVNSSAIVGIWLGDLASPYCALSMQVLSVAFFFQMLSGAVTSIGRGVGLIKYELECSVLSATLNVLLSIILIFQFGFLGALLGTTLAMAVSNIIYFVRFSRFMKIGFMKMIESILIKPFLCCSGAAVFCYYLSNFLVSSSASSDFSRIQTLLRLLIVGIAFLFVYVTGLLLSQAVGRSDLKLIGRAFSAIREFN